MELAVTGKVVAMEEIKRSFDAEWVLLENPITDDLPQVQSGTLLYHTKERAKLDRKMLEVRSKTWVLLYIGGWPAALTVAL